MSTTVAGISFSILSSSKTSSSKSSGLNATSSIPIYDFIASRASSSADNFFLALTKSKKVPILTSAKAAVVLKVVNPNDPYL